MKILVYRNKTNLTLSRFSLVLSIFLGLNAAPVLAGEVAGCIKTSEHSATTFLLVDKSDPIADVEKFQQSLKAVQAMVAPGERLVVGVSTGTYSDSRVLVDIVRPQKTIWESRMKFKVKDKAFVSCFEKMQHAIAEKDETYKTSALLETLQFVSDILSAEKEIPKRVVLYSDMMQNSSALSFYKAKSIDVENAMKKVNNEALLWDFKDVEFYIAGISGASDKKGRQVRQFWKAYIEKTGGDMKSYGPVLLASG